VRLALVEPPAEDLPRDPRWLSVLAGGVLVSCVVVPCLFTTRLAAVFVLPKLAALWTVLTLSLVVIAGGVIFSRTSPREALRLLPVDIAVALFLVLNVAAWSFSTDRRQSLYGERLQYQGLFAVLLMVGFFYVARLSLTDGRRLRLLASAITIGATLVACYALVQRTGLDPIWGGYLPMGRVFSSIGQPNALAAYLVLAVPIGASLLIAGKLVRGAISLALAAMILALALTLSRAGYLGFLVMLPILALGLRDPLRTSPKRLALGFAAMLCAALAIVALVQPARTAMADSWRRATSSTDVGGDSSLRFHLDAWNVAARIAADNPILGTGQETFPDIFPRYSHVVLPPDRAAALDAYRVESPHNVYLAIAAGAGFPALLAYLGIVAGFVAAVASAARRASTRGLRLALVAMLAASAGHLVTDAFMTADVTSTWLFWVLMGAGLGVASSARVPGATWSRDSPGAAACPPSRMRV